MDILKGKGGVVTGTASGIGKKRVGWQPVVAWALLLAFVFFPTAARGEEPRVQPGGGVTAHQSGDVAETGKKLSNPLSNVWALFTEFDLNFSDGNVNSGNEQVGGRMIFQPIVPIPLYGSEEKEWRLITRPTIPFLFSAPIPGGQDMFDHRGGLGDTQVPMVISPPAENWILGAGPTWLFPTSTENAFGRQQWGVGPAVVVGHYTEKVTLGVFSQYFFGIGSRGGRPSDVADASYLHLLYFLFYNLPNAWQIGSSPTITYDNRASSGNKWNVPVGLIVSKTTRIIGGMMAKFELGIEYSVVSQDAFGQRAAIKLSVIPVIPSLIRTPLFGR
ncbi:MAG: hypothetical protein EHM23_33060 [Acidobacteria bacterium]|nr:MAG: hypothetical protein EHM23_33060 [Acidobacteriota bacterium]